jgi:cyclase
MQELRRGVGYFKEKGGASAYLTTPEGIVVVDAQFPEQADRLIGNLRKISRQPFRLLVNTHHHADHTAGNISFRGLVEHVVAHENSLIHQRRAAREQNAEKRQLYPDITFTDTWHYAIASESIRAYHFGAAHTDGDSIIHFEEANIVHLGDLVFNRRWPYIDKKAGADIRGWIATLDRALATFDEETVFICGHALRPEQLLPTRDDIRLFQDYFGRLLDFVGTEVKTGKTKEAILEATDIPGVTEFEGEGIERGLAAAYQEVATSFGD